MKIKARICSLLVVLTLCLTSIWSDEAYVCYAYEDGDVTSSNNWYVYVNGEMPDITLKKGETFEVSLPLTANYTMSVRKIMIDVKETPFTVKGTPAIYYEGKQEATKSLGVGNYFLKFTLTAKKGTEDKTYHLPISFLAGYSDSDLATYSLMDMLPVSFQTEEAEVVGKASLSLSDITCEYDGEKLKIGETADIAYNLCNNGNGKAYDITISYDGFGDEGILPVNKNSTSTIATLAVASEKSITLPITPADNCVTGAKKISITVSYKETEKSTEFITLTDSIYIQVEGAEKKTDETTYAPKLRISNVKQTPSKPEAGGIVSVSYYVTNVGTKAAEGIIITPTNLTNATFTPIDKDASAYIKSLKVGGKKKVTMKFLVSEQIESGSNGIELSAVLKDSKGTEYTDSFHLYVTNLVAKEEDSAGVPKLIIQNYDTGDDVVRAGDEFTLSLDIMNAHGSLSANNIKVTITSDEAGTFTAAKGSNSFYISKIPANGSVHKEIQLKAKADSITKVYPLKVEFEYEYDGMELPKDTLSSGLVVSEVLNIQVAEDSRPALTNVIVGGYGELMCGEMNCLSFDFTNRGKSPLYNVEVVVTGDFQPATESYFIGTVEAGTGNNHEIEITPMADGTGNGLLTITYEDSNGTVGTIEEEFSGDIMPIMMDEPGEEFEIVEPEVEEETKPMIPLPAFLFLEIVLFVLSIVITRKVVIKLHIKKKMKEEEKELD